MTILKATATLLQPAIRSRAIGILSRPTPFILLHRPPTTTLSFLSSYSKSSFSTSSLSRAASEVSSKPASQSLPHAAQNAKEEAGAIVGDLAKGIAGKGGKGEFDAAAITRSQDATGPDNSIGDSFAQVTSAVASTVPQPILVMGLVGGLPYLGASLTTLYVARQASQAAAGLTAGTDITTAVALLESCSHFQVTYGAVMLSFLGALHWGMEFSKYGGYKGYSRLALGVAPLLGAWPTLMMEPQLALVAQWFLFTSLWYADMKATTAGWTPPWYSQYRFYLSILVGACILGTLFGVNYLGPTTDVALAKNLTETGVLGSSLGFMEHVVKGEYDAVEKTHKKRYAPENAKFWTEEGEDGFVKIVKKQEKEEGEGEGEGESEGEDAEGDEKSGDDAEKSEDDSSDDDDSGDKKESSKDDGAEDEQKDGDKKEDSKDNGDEDKSKSDDDSKDQKNPRAGETGENMESAKKDKEDLMKRRDGASKKK